MLHINWNPSGRELRQFAGVWLPAFAALAGAAVLYRFGWLTAAVVIWGAGATVAVTAWRNPGFARLVFVGWMVAAYPIGWTVSHVVLGAIYYGLFTLTGGIMRLVGYDPLRRRRRADAGSLWVEREPRKSAAAYFRQF